MGRPLNKKWFGNENTGGIAGSGVASVTINTAGTYTAGLPSVSFSTPNLAGAGGVTATGTVHGKLVTASTTVNGAGYTYNQQITLTGGTFTTAAVVRVTAITVATATKHLNTGTAYEDGDTITFSTGWSTPCVLRVNRPGGGSGSADDYTIINPGVRSAAAQTNPVSPDSTSDDDGNGAQVNFTYGVYSFDVVTEGDYTVMPSNDVSLSGGTTPAQATLTFGVKSVEITEAGSGYTTVADAAPTFDGGAAAGTSVLTTSSGIPYTDDAFPTILANAYIPASGSIGYVSGTGGSSSVFADIVKQEATRRFRVETAQGIGYCNLVAAAPSEGQMTIKATDSNSKTYYVTKITSRKATVVPYGASGHLFPVTVVVINGESTNQPQTVHWAMTTDTNIDPTYDAATTVIIENA